MKIDWTDLIVGLSVSFVVVIGVLGAVELMTDSLSIKMIGFYATITMIFIRELCWGIDRIIRSTKIGDAKGQESAQEKSDE